MDNAKTLYFPDVPQSALDLAPRGDGSATEGGDVAGAWSRSARDGGLSSPVTWGSSLVLEAECWGSAWAWAPLAGRTSPFLAALGSTLLLCPQHRRAGRELRGPQVACAASTRSRTMSALQPARPGE